MPTTYDRSHREELGEQTAYERWTLDQFRSRLFRQSESPNGMSVITLGDVTEKGDLRIYTSLEMARHLSGSAVAEALASFRVLAFISAFKLLDLIAEWILAASDVNLKELRWFKTKLAAYARLKTAGTLREPPELQRSSSVASAFWALYERLEPPRGAVVHTGKLRVESSGAFEIEDRNGVTTRLDVEMQAAFIRFACLLAGTLVGEPKSTAFHQALLEKTLGHLTPLHGFSFSSRPIRFEAVRLNVPAALAKQMNPYSCEVDLGAIRTLMQQSSPAGPGGELFLTVEVVADAGDRELVWQLPPEAVPVGQIELREDDPALQSHLEIRVRTPPATLPSPA